MDILNKVICDGVFDYFASHHGTRSPCSHADRSQRKKHSRHNRELKRLRKDKVNAMRHLRQAQRERKPEGIMRTLRSTYLKSTRMYSKALKRSRRFGDERMAMKMKKEYNASFWRFASKVLDNDSTSKVSPNFSLESAERFFSNTYSSTPSTFSQPSWIPTPTEPIECFDTDPIRMDEVISVIKRAKVASSPSPLDAISYKILKRCPSLSAALLALYNRCWESSVVPRVWKQASIKPIPTSCAMEDPSDPAKFRPIALTSCIGKVYTSIIKDRWLHFMRVNQYLDTKFQKAFMPSVPGCIEHYTKLATAINEACTCHKSLCVCWLDLANAYGSVHHDLIRFSLLHYHAPSKLIDMVSNLYQGLNASISIPAGRTKAIPLEIGLYQGDPLSVTIFNTVMNTYLDGLKRLQMCGYKFSNSLQSLYVLQYADDTCLVTDGTASCRAMLDFTDMWLQWSQMKAKVSKCQSMAIEASTGKLYDPKLKVAGGDIPFVGNSPVRFLGGQSRYHETRHLPGTL